MHFPKQIKWLLLHTFILLLLFSSYRLLLFYNYNSTHQSLTGNMLWYGFRYDVRIIAAMLLPVYIVSSFSKLSPFYHNNNKKFWTIYLTLFYSITLLFFVVDYEWYAYRSTRLDGEIISYANDAAISMQMAWQSYPILKIMFGLGLLIIIVYLVIKFVNKKAKHFTTVKNNKTKVTLHICYTLVMLLSIYGKLGQYPLRWSDAANINNEYKAAMALNPMQSFFSSLKYANEKPNVAATKQYYSTIATMLQLPVTDTAFNYTRLVKGTATTKPNIVLVFCESYSYYKSSMSGNPLNATPYFNALSKQGIFFTKCFSPAYGTARGVWATITGIPDVTLTKTATRIPRAVKQHTIINDFTDYSKYYFIGGDASWANIRGLIKNNITDLKLYEQDDYTEPKMDVWGVSDRSLFSEANKTLSKETKPFFAIIQTANNHRPYTIPATDTEEMGLQKQPLDSLIKYGYNIENNEAKTNEEFNAMRYMDFCINDFLAKAKKETWYNNTIFLFMGDHGIRGNGGTLIPEVYNQKGLTCEHIPMLIYSPLLQPQQYDFPCSQIDALPTLAALAGVQHTNTTLGRNLLQIAKDSTAQKFAFIFDIDVKEYGIIDNYNYYFTQIKGGKEGILPLANNNNTPPISYYKNLANSMYETSKYMIYNNH